MKPKTFVCPKWPTGVPNRGHRCPKLQGVPSGKGFFPPEKQRERKRPPVKFRSSALRPSVKAPGLGGKGTLEGNPPRWGGLEVWGDPKHARKSGGGSGQGP